MLNIVISFVLEIYGSIGDEIQDHENKLELARQLIKRFKDEDDEEAALEKAVEEMQQMDKRLAFGLQADEFMSEVQ